MARSNREVPFGGLSADDQAQIDEMRNNDAGPVGEEEAGQAAAAVPDPAEQPEAPQADPAAAPAAPPEQQRAATVPHAALHEERELRKAAEQRLAEIERQAADDRRQRQILEERTNLLLGRMGQLQPAQQPAQQPQLPPVEQDPLGHFNGRMQQHEQVLGELVRAAQGRGQQEQQAQAVQALQSRMVAAESEFRARTPDYDNAAQHLLDVRHRQLTAAGFTDPAERMAMIRQEAVGLAAQAVRSNRNAGEIVYELAKIVGYAPPAPAAQTNGADNGSAAPREAAAEADAGQRLQTLAQGQQQARSLGNVRGSGPAPVNANTLANMSWEEFHEWANKTTPAQKRQVLGV